VVSNTLEPTRESTGFLDIPQQRPGVAGDTVDGYKHKKATMKSARWTGLSLGFVIVGLCVATPAYAHNQVVSLSPEANSTLTTSPVSISVTTGDELLDLGGAGRGFAVAVTDSSGLFYGDGCVSVEGGTMTSVVDLGEQGTYTITYQYVSADGHSLSDRYTVRFEPTGSHTPSVGHHEAPVCGEDPLVKVESTTNAAPEPVTDPAPEETQQPNTGLVVASLGVAVLAIAALITLLRRGKSRS